MGSLKLLREAEEYARMEYPRPGQPLKNHLDCYHSHVVDSGSTGKFAKTHHLTEFGAWEESVILSAEMKRMKKLSGKY
jgi:hypothetical protein